MHLTPSRRRRIVGACAAALVLPLAVTAGTASAAPALPTPPAPPAVTLAVPGVVTLSMKPGAVPAVVAPALGSVPADPHGAKIVGIAERPSPGQFDVAIWSPTMNRNILVHVLAPPGYDRAKTPAVTYPVVYLLDGLRAPNTTSDWVDKGGAVDFFKNKNALVVMSVGGAAASSRTGPRTIRRCLLSTTTPTSIQDRRPASLDGRPS
jgi:S-formylglutathione hydrolase FrmB